jgi:hypothetical protein
MIYIYKSMAFDHHIHEVMQQFDPVTLGEMDAVKLMNRTDIKYLFSATKLKDLLTLSREAYQILEINGNRDFHYRSLYLDTDGHLLYSAHHNGARPRFKVRFREYVDTRTTFLEIKQKTNKERTRKTRIQVEAVEMELTERSLRFIDSQVPLQAADLRPAMWSIFNRITLVGKNSPERITIDHDLSFSHGEASQDLPFLAITEVKRDSMAGKTAFMDVLKQLSIHTGNSSKYCLGTVLLKDEIKRNRFKTNLLKLKHLENDFRSYPAAG